MNEDHIKKVQDLLMQWNPLGERAKKIEDLNDYETEAIDILWYIDKKSTVERINNIMVQILNEGFHLNLDRKGSIKWAEKIKNIITEK